MSEEKGVYEVTPREPAPTPTLRRELFRIRAPVTPYMLLRYTAMAAEVCGSQWWLDADGAWIVFWVDGAVGLSLTGNGSGAKI